MTRLWLIGEPPPPRRAGEDGKVTMVTDGGDGDASLVQPQGQMQSLLSITWSEAEAQPREEGEEVGGVAGEEEKVEENRILLHQQLRLLRLAEVLKFKGQV